MSKANRGEIWIVDLGLAAKIRPCLVLSVPFSDQERSLVTVVAHTTSARGGRFEMAVSTPILKAGVFDAQNLVTIPEVRLVRRVGTLRPEQLASIENSVRAWLGLWLGCGP
jgi:mRNA interferase MazF